MNLVIISIILLFIVYFSYNIWKGYNEKENKQEQNKENELLRIENIEMQTENEAYYENDLRNKYLDEEMSFNDSNRTKLTIDAQRGISELVNKISLSDAYIIAIQRLGWYIVDEKDKRICNAHKATISKMKLKIDEIIKDENDEFESLSDIIFQESKVSNLHAINIAKLEKELYSNNSSVNDYFFSNLLTDYDKSTLQEELNNRRKTISELRIELGEQINEESIFNMFTYEIDKLAECTVNVNDEAICEEIRGNIAIIKIDISELQRDSWKIEKLGEELFKVIVESKIYAKAQLD